MVYLMASRLADDAVIACHSALQLLGKAHSHPNGSHTSTRVARSRSGSRTLSSCPFSCPRPCASCTTLAAASGSSAVVGSRYACWLRVTVGRRYGFPGAWRHGDSWEEIWRSLEGLKFVDLSISTSSSSTRCVLNLLDGRSRGLLP